MKFAVAATLVLALDGALAFTSKPAFTRPSTQCDVVVDGRTMEKEVKPTNNFVLVKLPDALESTAGGLFLTGKAKVKKTEGKVVSVGPGRLHHETGVKYDMPVKAGEGVVYGNFDGIEIDIDGAKHFLIRDDDIFVKFTGDELTLESVDVLRDVILIEVEKSEEKPDSVILVAQSSKTKKKNSSGKVVKVGPGRMATNGKATLAMDVAPGDFVKFRDFAGNDVEIEDKNYVVVRMPDILCKY
jgi:chaperonin GroES